MRPGRTPHASRCAPTPSDVTKGTSSGGIARSATGTGWNRLGPAMREGDARDPHTGSVSTRRAPNSSSTVECPSQVARKRLAGAVRHAAIGSNAGSGPFGTRCSPPQRKSLIESEAFGSRKPGGMGCRLRNLSPSKRGDALSRSSRAPSGLLPSDFIRCPLMRHGSLQRQAFPRLGACSRGAVADALGTIGQLPPCGVAGSVDRDRPEEPLAEGPIGLPASNGYFSEAAYHLPEQTASTDTKQRRGE